MPAILRRSAPRAKHSQEDLFLMQCRADDVIRHRGDPKRQWKFHPIRRWAFDFAWPAWKVAAEVEGGVFIPGGGGHTRGKAFEANCEKYAEAAILGWTVLRFSSDQVKRGEAIAWTKRLMEAKR